MQRRYRVQADMDEMFFTVHEQDCSQYPQNPPEEAPPFKRIVDLGTHQNGSAALQQARQDFPQPWHFAQCLCLGLAD